jgi:hypothetical protein
MWKFNINRKNNSIVIKIYFLNLVLNIVLYNLFKWSNFCNLKIFLILFNRVKILNTCCVEYIKCTYKSLIGLQVLLYDF